MGWLVNHWRGVAGVQGVAPPAIVPVLARGSGWFSIDLAGKYGDASGVGTQGDLMLNEGLFFAMPVSGGSGMADIPLTAILAGGG